MKMVVISTDEYEKLKNEKKESETKIESYKQCIAGYESRIKELTEECDNLKDQYRSAIAKRVLNNAYGVEQDVCCIISKSLNASMFDKTLELSEENEKLAEKNHKLEIKVPSLETELKDCKYMYENKLKNTEATLHSIAIDKRACDSIIKTLRSQAEEDANKMKELRQKYEAVLKANEKLAAENACLANNPETTKLNNELMTLKKQYRDLNNAYKSQKNELTNRKKLLADVATEINNIYEHMKAEVGPIKMLAIDLRSFML